MIADDERITREIIKLLLRGQPDIAQVIEAKDGNQTLKYVAEQRNELYKTRLIIKEPGRIRFIGVKQINYIAGAGNYAEVHLFDGSCVLHRETLTNLETQLDPEIFIRIHRSSIVRRSSIRELQPNDKGDYSVLLKSGEALTLSRRYKAKLAKWLNG